jgi:hypothetical protein
LAHEGGDSFPQKVSVAYYFAVYLGAESALAISDEGVGKKLAGTSVRLVVMPVRPCLVCGALSDQGHCPQHRKEKKRFTGPTAHTRDYKSHRRFAIAVKERDGWRCRALLETGRRCPNSRSTGWTMFAHHLRPSGGDVPANGVTLCAAHHRAVDPYAR